ncbi:MAG: hypothetical protein LBU66_00600 [Treponema sp.]|jgi:hypothetical protein|nr:hypothetical protein [Treponema sp.]
MNNRTRFILMVFLMLGITLNLSALGSRDKSPASDTPSENAIRITGVVRLVGSSLFAELVISNPDGEWYIAKDEMDKLFDLQQQTVTVEGEETVTELFFANGTSAGIRRELKNVRLIR